MRDKTLLAPYDLLLARHGPQHWWPGETAFEVMVGAVLTQNTAWANVEKAIANLRRADALGCAAILGLGDGELAEQLRPAGYFNVKARRLKSLCGFLAARGVTEAPEELADQGGLAELRHDLLAVHGIGEETADSILLYALDLPSFVVDAYTRRIFARLGLLRGSETYADIQRLIEANLPRDRRLYNEYHALIVRLGKEQCRPRPRCADCPLNPICPTAP
ncbi:MAG: endonuclease III domain-containing protein [Gallionellaceae bacterium]|nr:endonuclease III domain-containing protein [Gallionellaceae bacterium]